MLILDAADRVLATAGSCSILNALQSVTKLSSFWHETIVLVA